MPRTGFLFLLILALASAGWFARSQPKPVSAPPSLVGGGAIDNSADVGSTSDAGTLLDKNCDENWICVEPVQRSDGVEFYVENLREAPLTATLKVGGGSGYKNRERVVTATLNGKTRERLATIETTATDSKFHYEYRWTVGRQQPLHDDSYLYRLPYARGKGYSVLQGYGSRFSHTGLEQYAIDFNMPEGTPVYAAREGRVVRVIESNDRACWESGCAKYANFIVVLHPDDTTGEYYHLQKNGALVNEGDYVTAGQEIARSGNTGHSTMAHLHFAVYKASSWGSTQSIPVKFSSAAGIVEQPRRGGRYVAE